jgi:large exoprotein involved in heme utilization and adhesion
MPVKTKRHALAPKTLTLAVAAAFLPAGVALAEPAANQLPTGGQVGAGSVAISTAGSKMQIDQSSDKAIINWNCFCIGANAWVNINQPSASSVVLNRSTQAAEIFGRLSANGQVFVTSGAGVYFARTAQVDVGALLASNLTIRDQDFLAGRYVFSNEGSSGAVVNEGTIITPAGYAALAGTQVRNHGVIIAQAGTVALAAGDRVSLDMIGDGLVRVSVDAAALNALALNAGTIQADGGRVVLTARSANALLDTVVNNTGVIRARSLVERNGEIVLDGGSAGTVAHTGSIDASGGAEGTNGGTVTVRGQNVFVYGGIDARGAGESGRGGMVETSGNYIEIGQAPEIGAGGTWLIDPYNITVVAGAGSTNNAGSPTFTPTGDSSQIGNALINGQLNAGTSVVLDTGGAGSPGTQAGDITVDAIITKSVANGAGLTLTANNNVNINASVNLLNGGVTINAGGQVNVTAAGANNAQVIGTNQTINAQGLNLSARDGRLAGVINTGGNQTITTGTGGVNLDVLNGAGVAQIVQTASGASQDVSTTGALNVVGGSSGLSANSGVFANVAGTTQNVTAAAITLQGANSGVSNGGALISSTPNVGIAGNQTINVAGNITLTGGSAGTNNRAGIATNGANQTINAGNLLLTSGAGSDASATVTAPRQTITVGNDVLVSGGAGGGPVNGSRIGGLGGTAPSATDLTLHVGRDLLVTGGTGVGASIGSTVTAATPHTINIDAGRDVILTAGSGGPVRVGSTFSLAPAAGEISISAGRDIQMNGTGAQSAAIRTAGNATLSAGGSITQNQANAAITAAQLSTSSMGNTALIGDNRLTSYQGSTTAGNLSLHNVGSLAISGPVSSSGALELNVQGGLTLNADAQDVIVTSRNGQTVLADSLSLQAQNGRRAVMQNLVAGGQLVSVGSGGIDLDAVGGAGVAQIVNTASGGSQLVSTSGTLHVAGGVAAPSSNSGIFLTGIGAGNQTVNAGAIVLQGANNGLANSGALISTSQGDQSVSASGDITMTAGSVGNTGIFGAAGRNQSVSAHNISLTNSADTATSNNSGAFILGGHQQINASGDVTLTSRASGGSLAGIRIGSVSGGTDLSLNAGGNVVLTGGTAANNGVGLGSSAAGVAQPNTITVAAGGDVILNGGVAGSGARIGSGPNGVPSGNISVTARDIQLNGGGSAAAIRTAGNVTLNASGSISETGNGFVQGAALTSTSQGATNLGGPNLVGTYNGSTSIGDLAFSNGQSVTVTGGFVGGNASLATTGTGSDMTIAGNLSSAGTMSLDVAGSLTVTATGPQQAFVNANGGQTINAQSLLVTANGAAAQITNFGGDQAITIDGGGTGAGVDVRTTGSGGNAAIVNQSAGSQSITVSDAAHINVDATSAGGSALILSFGNQNLSISGSGANAINLGSAGALGSSTVNASGNQTVTAGTAGESGSISIVGPAANNRLAGFVTNAGTGSQTQTISTSGTLSVTASSAPSQGSNFGTGIFHNRQGLQTINAADIIVSGGTGGGSNNTAFISTNPGSPGGPGGRDQLINVSGSITVTGSDAGTNNRALIVANNGNQTINAGGDITIHAGASGVPGTSNASIATNTAGRQQTISARNIALSNATSGGTDSVASILGTNQLINASGNVTLTAGGSGGTLAGVRIGGFGGAAPSASNVTLNIGGDLVLTGGTAPSNGVGIGSSAAGTAQANTIAITAGGDVILNGGGAEGSGARIGSATNGVAGGDISVTARDIRLNGGVAAAAIRTTGNVELHGNTISETGNGFVQAGQLLTTSQGTTSLVGPNQVSQFTGNSDAGDISLRNTSSVLTLGNMSFSGSLTVDQTGALAVPGTVTAGNQALSATGDVTIGGAGGSAAAGLFAPGSISISTPGSIVLRGSDVASGGSSVVSAGGLATLNAGEVRLVGGAAPLAAATVMGGELDVTSAGNIYVLSGSGSQANALFYSRNNVTMTIGGTLTIDGNGDTSWARVQTERYDGTITLNFPNAASGGVSVDGFEDKFKHGQDGLLTADKPAKLGTTLFLNYGL